MIKNTILKDLWTDLQNMKQTPELDRVILSLQDLIKANEQAAGQGNALTREQAEKLKQQYGDFVTICEEYCKGPQTGKEVYDIKAAMTPVNSYIRMLTEIAAGTLKHVTMEQVLCNDHLFEGLFQSVNGTPDEPDFVPADSGVMTEQTPEYALNQYKAIAKDTSSNLKNHLAKVVDAPTEKAVFNVLGAKLRLLQRILDANHKPKAKKNPNLSWINTQWKDFIKNSDLQATKFPVQYVSKKLFEGGFEQTLDMTVVTGKVDERITLNTEAQNSLDKELFKLKISASRAGLNNVKKDRIDTFIAAALGPVFVMQDVITAKELDKEAIKNDKNHPVHGLLESTEIIRKKAESYIKGEKNAEPPTLDDFRRYGQELEAYMKKFFWVKGRNSYHIDSVISMNLNTMKIMSDYYGALKKDYNKYLKIYQ